MVSGGCLGKHSAPHRSRQCQTVSPLMPGERMSLDGSMMEAELKMNRFTKGLMLAIVSLCSCITHTASAQLDVGCMEISPERQGGIGCTSIAKKPLPGDLKAPLFWHVERFDSAERARAAAGSSSIALEAHGSW